MAILLFAGKDATTEFVIHHTPDAVIGTLGDGGEDDDEDSSEEGYTIEVAKHNKKSELAILTFAGKDAATEFDMIYPPDVVEKYAPDAIIGFVGNGKAKGAAKSALPVATDKGDTVANLEAWGDWRMEVFDNTPGVLLVNVRSYVNACYYLILDIICGICAIILSAKNFKTVSLFFFIVVHVVGNLHMFKGPDDFNGHGYCTFVCTSLGFQTNIVDEHVLLNALLHIFAGLKRTRDQKLSSGLMSGQSSLTIFGLMLLMFMTIHLSQLRFANTE